MTGGSFYFLDLTVLERQEGWEEPTGRVTAARGAIPDFLTPAAPRAPRPG
jgi:hypothetical protein